MSKMAANFIFYHSLELKVDRKCLQDFLVNCLRMLNVFHFVLIKIAYSVNIAFPLSLSSKSTYMRACNEVRIWVRTGREP